MLTIYVRRDQFVLYLVGIKSTFVCFIHFVGELKLLVVHSVMRHIQHVLYMLTEL